MARALKIVVDDGPADDDGRLDVGDLVRMFEESEDATLDARQNAERDRDYVDNIQHTAEEIAALEKRGQPIVTDNRIKTKIDFLVGLEKEQRIDPKALPRTPIHEDDADGASQALRYTCDTNDYDNKRSGVWRNMLVEGAGGIRVYAEPSRKSYGGQPGYGGMMGSTALTQPKQEFDIKIAKVPWDRMFWDPHSSEPDFSDAGYLGIVVWLDYGDALAKYPDGREALDITMGSTSQGDTYDDKPKFTVWADKKRKRVRVCQIWIKRDEEWFFAEFTKGGILKAGPSPYKTDTGESDCELFFQSAFVNRENDRYGYVREMISPQDEINKRRSKTLHALNTKQVFFLTGAVNDVEKARTQIARPDGAIEVNQVVQGPIDQQIHVVSNTEMTEGNFKLLVEAQNAIDLKGPNATMLGDKAQGSAAASGKAIIASQQGGRISLGDLSDNLRHLDIRVFRAVWNRIRQYWTAEKWIRTTDDERNIKWVAMNVDRGQLAMLTQQDPEAAQKISGSVSNVAELDCDIIIDEGPDTLTPQLEQFQALVELKKMDAENKIPFRAIVEAIPNLRNRQQFLASMDEAEQQAAQQPPPPPPEIVKAQIDGEVKQKIAQQDAQIAQQKMAIDGEMKMQEQQRAALLKQQEIAAELELQREKAETEITLQREKAAAEIALAREKAEAELQLKHHVAMMDAQIKRETTEADIGLAERKMDTEAKHAERKIDLDAKAKAAAAKDKEPDKPDRKEGKSDPAMAAAMTAIAQSQTAIAHAIKQSSAPRSIRKGADGSYRSEVG